MYYTEILEALQSKNVRYLIIGGLAVNLYGVPRVTQDVDLIISTDRSNILRLISVLKSLGYVPRLPVDPEKLADPDTVADWTKNKNMKAFSFYNKKENYKVVDIVLVHPLNFESSFKNKTVKKVKDVKIFLASMDDLVRTKEESGRPQDISDIEMLKKLRKFLEEEP
jgi:hypothetical protein